MHRWWGPLSDGRGQWSLWWHSGKRGGSAARPRAMTADPETVTQSTTPELESLYHWEKRINVRQSDERLRDEGTNGWSPANRTDDEGH